MKKIISLSAALIMVSAFAAGCGKNSSSSSSEKEKSKFEGKWQCTGITEGNDVMTDIMGTDASALFQIELFDENKGKFFSFIFGASEEPQTGCNRQSGTHYGAGRYRFATRGAGCWFAKGARNSHACGGKLSGSRKPGNPKRF